MTHHIQNNPNRPPYYIPKKEKNNVGLAGFIISLIALFYGWIPIFGWMIWFAGFILCLIGLAKYPKALAISGLIISVFSILFILGTSLILFVLALIDFIIPF